MKLNTRMRYGTRAMVELASMYEGGPMTIKEIAEKQKLSPKYLEHLFAALQAAGLITATRGPNGGYILARPPGSINLRDIYFVFEGPGGFVPCMDDPRACHRSEYCVTRDIWVRLHGALLDTLKATTLEELVYKAQERLGAALMYYI